MRTGINDNIHVHSLQQESGGIVTVNTIYKAF